MEGDRLGNFEAICVARDGTADNSLTFRLEFDQTEIPRMVGNRPQSLEPIFFPRSSIRTGLSSRRRIKGKSAPPLEWTPMTIDRILPPSSRAMRAERRCVRWGIASTGAPDAAFCGPATTSFDCPTSFNLNSWRSFLLHVPRTQGEGADGSHPARCSPATGAMQNCIRGGIICRERCQNVAT
jgi:hypothetical protein